MYIGFSCYCQHLSTLALLHDLDSAVLWADTWQLNFNVDICSKLHFGYGNENNIYLIREQQVTATESQKDLGVIISQNLKLSKHVCHIVKQAEKMLAVLKRTIVTRDQKIFLKLYKQLVRPHLEYVAIIWNPHFKHDINLIERVQKRATRCIIGMSGKSYEKCLGILKLESLAK